MIYVNSTLPAEAKQAREDGVSSIHYWSYKPSKEDLVLAHPDTRIGVRTRWLLKSWDPWVLAKAMRSLKKHHGKLYLVTQPDLIGALPLLAGLHREAHFMTWVWMPQEVKSWKRGLKACKSILALTTPALEAVKSINPAASTTLGLWEIEPNHYAKIGSRSVARDVALIGRTRRSIEGTVRLIAPEMNVGSSERAHPAFAASMPATALITAPVPAILAESAATLIFFEGPTEEPLGYTNLVEALACGCAVAIPSDSTIPEIVLNLPGVFRFDRNSVEDGQNALAEAVSYGRDEAQRSRTQDACFALLGAGTTARWIAQEFA